MFGIKDLAAEHVLSDECDPVPVVSKPRSTADDRKAIVTARVKITSPRSPDTEMYLFGSVSTSHVIGGSHVDLQYYLASTR